MELEAKIEAILFFRGEPTSVNRLAKICDTKENDVREVLKTLEKSLGGRGVNLIWKDDEVMLGTAPEASEIIARITKEELTRDIGRAGLETLSIVIYRGPISRRDIDYIRGVNSNFIVRNLLIRGLVERLPNPKDERVFLYRPTFDLLSFLGIMKIEDLPEYETVRKEIEEGEKEPLEDTETIPPVESKNQL